MSTSRSRFDVLLRLVATLLALASAVVLVTAALRSDGWALSWLGFPLVGAIIVNSRPRTPGESEVGATPDNMEALESGELQGPPHFTEGITEEFTVEG
ncbi:MAG TPA: hypothetical protein VLA91_15860 [Acidimicrobiia bacterium]|nr:hypothetical protein [Acidimicrobiia bacterium]